MREAGKDDRPGLGNGPRSFWGFLDNEMGWAGWRWEVKNPCWEAPVWVQVLKRNFRKVGPGRLDF